MSEKYSYGKKRFWEMFPGLLVWGTFALSIGLSFVKPLWVIIFIIVFDLLWLFRVVYFNIFMFLSWWKYNKTKKTNWQSIIEEMNETKNKYHLIFLPTYKEDFEIIKATIDSLKNNSFPNSRMIIVLGGEESDHDNFTQVSMKIQNEFAGVFKGLFITEHPSGLVGEISGKGSNLNWMGNRMVEVLDKNFSEIKDENIIVSAFDVDTIAHEQYFSYLTYLYCTVENPTHVSYQPIALFSNNIWTASAPVRVGAFGTTFWLFGELARPDRLWTFSSHSMPWKMLKDVGFWQKDIVSEDSRIFMQAFFHYDGNYRVEPMFLPVSMDTVTGKNYFESLKALYVQMRRWAWGVEHLPFLVDGFSRKKDISLGIKLKYLFNHIEGMFTWATAPILMFVLGWLPLWVSNGQTNAIVQAAPFTLEQLMQFAMIGMLISSIMALTLLPKRPSNVNKHTWVVMVFQWLLLPITFIVFGSFPAIDAQSRLMLGKYLGFNVTKKHRSK